MKIDEIKEYDGEVVQKRFEMTITDEAGGFICRKLSFDEDKLPFLAIEVDGLRRLIEQYNDRMEGNSCEGCD
ncbi:MAG: hypothetical protein ABSF14_23770 [Terriglobia bacterium]|jgi:hypothetical protein